MVIKTFQFIGDIIGQIERKDGCFMYSTNTYINEEYRCYLLKDNNKTYLTSFDNLKTAKEYLIQLENSRTNIIIP